MERKKEKFWHGTTDIFNVDSYILPPEQTNNLRECFRKKNLDVVFLTNSYVSALKYAKKAAVQFGGKPVVYECVPVGKWYYGKNAEVITEKAKIVKTFVC